MTGDSSAAGSSAYVGCLTADGRERWLESFGPGNIDNRSGGSTAAVAGDYAALVNFTIDQHCGGGSYTVEVYELRTGSRIPDRGGETVSGPVLSGCSSYIDHVVVGSGGVSAAQTIFGRGCPPVTSTQCPTEQIVASDSTGVHTLDTCTGSDLEEPSALTGLSLSGDMLTWLHVGSPRSAVLH